MKPLDDKLLEEVASRFSRIITIEDGVRNGGLGSAVTEWMSDHGYTPQISRSCCTVPCSTKWSGIPIRVICGIDLESIKKELIKAN